MIRHTTISITMLMTWFLGGCGLFSGAPQEAIDQAFNHLNTKGYYCRTQAKWVAPTECSQFLVDFTKEKEVTPADKQNGYNKILDIGVDYLYRQKAGENWESWRDKSSCVRMAQNEDGWTPITFCN